GIPKATSKSDMLAQAMPYRWCEMAATSALGIGSGLSTCSRTALRRVRSPGERTWDFRLQSVGCHAFSRPLAKAVLDEGVSIAHCTQRRQTRPAAPAFSSVESEP